MQAMMASGAGYRPRVCFLIIAGATGSIDATAGLLGRPPGTL